MPTYGATLYKGSLLTLTLPGPVGRIVVTQVSQSFNTATASSTAVTVDGSTPQTIPVNSSVTTSTPVGPFNNQQFLPASAGANVVFIPALVNGQPAATVTVKLLNTGDTGSVAPDVSVSW